MKIGGANIDYNYKITAPKEFMWEDHLATWDYNKRFDGWRYRIETCEGPLVLYARETASGEIELFTGIKKMAPIYKPASQVTLDDVILYMPCTEFGPLDAFYGYYDKSFQRENHNVINEM